MTWDQPFRLQLWDLPRVCAICQHPIRPGEQARDFHAAHRRDDLSAHAECLAASKGIDAAAEGETVL